VARATAVSLVVALAVAALAAPAARAASPLPGQTFTIAWGGDVTPGSDYGLPPDHGRGMLAGVAELLRSADVAAVNLEGTLGLGGAAKCAKGAGRNCFSFQAPADNAIALAAPGVDVVNLANNHAYDYGPVGAALTDAALRRFGIAATGPPAQITYVDLPQARVAFLGFAAYPWASPLRDLPAVRALVRRAAARANVVVAFAHGGAEGAGQTHTPDRDEVAYGERRGNLRAFAHAAVDAGADLVLGSGPHVLRGIERYHDRLIAYSLGNLAGYRNFGRSGTTALSGLLRVRVTAGGAFAAGTFSSLRLVGPGLPRTDPTGAAARLVRTVSRQDFGARGVGIAPDGALTP
jgi:poly-gamma-glutamate capsule biosynthesis protein CapA/YwtB (metallophosphatase superfamily)